MTSITASARDAPILDDRIRGVPPGTSAFSALEIAARGWRPTDGAMSLPILTLDESAFLHNRDLMHACTRAAGVEIAPHAKTPMAPDLARSLAEAGAWGATVADIGQATVMLRSGIPRLLIANEVGGIEGTRRLAALASFSPQSELYVFANSARVVWALDAAWRETSTAPALSVLVEVGTGRAGAHSRREALAVANAVVSSGGRLRLAGLTTYEGSATKETPEATDVSIEVLLRLAADTLTDARALAGPESPLLVAAGGSSFFDRVVAALKPAIVNDGRAKLVIRSGVIFLHDHGAYDRALATLDRRQGFSINAMSAKRVGRSGQPGGYGRKSSRVPNPISRFAAWGCATSRSTRDSRLHCASIAAAGRSPRSRPLTFSSSMTSTPSWDSRGATTLRSATSSNLESLSLAPVSTDMGLPHFACWLKPR